MIGLLWKRSAWLTALAGLSLAWTSAGGPVSVAAAGDDASKVAEGKPAPEVNLPATQVGLVLPEQKNARTLHLSDLKGKKNVVLYFFPKAMTRG